MREVSPILRSVTLCSHARSVAHALGTATEDFAHPPERAEVLCVDENPRFKLWIACNRLPMGRTRYAASSTCRSVLILAVSSTTERAAVA